MFRSRLNPLAGRRARVRPRRGISALLLAALVAATSLTGVLPPRPAGADHLADLRARAASLAQRLVLQQLEVDAYRQQYSVASAAVAADARDIARIDRQIAVDQHQIDARTAAVRRQAIRAYTSYGTGTGASGPEATLFSGNQDRTQAASEYSGIAVGNITTAVDGLRAAEDTFQAEEAASRHQQAVDLSDQEQRSAALTQADTTRSQLEASQAEVTGQLATAVAQEAAARSAAAARAVAKARRAAVGSSSPAHGSTGAPAATAGTVPSAAAGPASVSAAPAGSAAGGAPPVGGGATSDPALNPFLQCVVQAESGGNYGAVSPNGLYMGAFQFSQSTWDTAAQVAGLPALVGVHPNLASKADQDTVAVALYALDGEQPWLGDRCSS